MPSASECQSATASELGETFIPRLMMMMMMMMMKIILMGSTGVVAKMVILLLFINKYYVVTLLLLCLPHAPSQFTNIRIYQGETYLVY